MDNTKTQQLLNRLAWLSQLEKGKPMPIGTVRDWGGRKYIKQAGNQWTPVLHEGGRSEKPSESKQSVAPEASVATESEVKTLPADEGRPTNNLGPPPPERQSYIKPGKDLSVNEVESFISEFKEDFKNIEKMNSDLKQLGAQEFAARLKDRLSLHGKMTGRLEDRSLNTVTDVIGTRALINSLQEQKKLVEKVKEKYDIVDIEDFSDEGRPDGYRAVHALFRTPSGKIAELQIKTYNQQAFAGYTHDNIYKGEANLKNDPEVQKFTKELSDYLSNLDKGKDPGDKPKEPKILADKGMLFPWDEVQTSKDLSKAEKMKYYVVIRAKDKTPVHIEERDNLKSAEKFTKELKLDGHPGELPIVQANSAKEVQSVFSEYKVKGPGSRGGKIVGWTKSGHPKYESMRKSMAVEEDPPYYVGLVIASITPEGRKVLLGKRKEDDKWTGPGGGAKPGESPLQVAVREAFEEANLRLQTSQLMELESYVTGNGKPCHCFLAYIGDKDVVETHTKNDPDDEVWGWKWFPVDSLPPLKERRLETMNDARMKMEGLTKSLQNALEKAKGEGSRGGKVIGHTKSGKPIYATYNHSTHSTFTEDDHVDAAAAHHHHFSTPEGKKTNLKHAQSHSMHINDKEKRRKAQDKEHGKNIATEIKGPPKKTSEEKFQEHEERAKRKEARERERAQKPFLKKSGGEGSRGGKVIGRTKSGKPIYASHKHPAHEDLTPQEHREAANLHSDIHDAAQRRVSEKQKDNPKYDPPQKVKEFIGDRQSAIAHHTRLSNPKWTGMKKSTVDMGDIGTSLNTGEHSLEINDEQLDSWRKRLEDLMHDYTYGDMPRTMVLDNGSSLNIVKVDQGMYSGFVKRAEDDFEENPTRIERLTIPAIVQLLHAKGMIEAEPSMEEVHEELEQEIEDDLAFEETSSSKESLLEALKNITVQGDLNIIMKGEKAPIGTVRYWQGLKFVKQDDGRWTPHHKEADK